MKKLQTHRAKSLWLAAAGSFCLALPITHAVQVDLASGDSGSVNGALFQWTAEQPTGTGFIDPFVRIQNNGVEQGYNTSGRPFAFDQKEPLNYTHDIQVSQLGAGVTVDGVDYYQFLLDINEPGGNKSLLSMDALQFYTSPTGSKTTSDVGSLGTLRYDLDMGADSWVLLDASRNSGSGSGDMFAFIPKSAFAGASADDFVYLYSKFGENVTAEGGAEAGFEEWAVVASSGGGGGAGPIPEPSTYLLLGSFLTLAVFLKRRRQSQTTDSQS
ncbi:MAG: PEP-CTERM sorting domain-containing protein [Verrucomicrobiota bacterium]